MIPRARVAVTTTKMVRTKDEKGPKEYNLSKGTEVVKVVENVHEDDDKHDEIEMIKDNNAEGSEYDDLFRKKLEPE